MALNFFRKHYSNSNVLSTALFAIKNYIYGEDLRFYRKMNHKAADKTLKQYFLKEFKATCKNASESE